MIEYIKGDIAEITPAMAVIDCNGVGYGINISLNTYSAIQIKHVPNSIFMKPSVKTHTCSTDSLPSRKENCFTVNLCIGYWRKYRKNDLSALSPSELCGVISSGNDKLLKTVKGIGLKTAQRIIVDLKDKIASSGMETVNSEMFASAANSEIHDEAVAALTMLGFAQAASQKVVAAILKEEPSAPVEKSLSWL